MRSELIFGVQESLELRYPLECLLQHRAWKGQRSVGQKIACLPILACGACGPPEW